MSGFKNRSVQTHQFSMIPRADIPRSSFRMEKGYKTTFDADYLVPIFCEEVLPGDSFHGKFTCLVRTETMLYPVMDNLHLETFFFFVPNRLVWLNWKKFMGEQATPGDSIDYTIPTFGVDGTNCVAGSVFDYFGLPAGMLSGAVGVNALPFRAYNLIWNEWFRDQNLNNPANIANGDSDAATNYLLLRRGKRHDYFTSALPWTQKGDAVQLPLGTSATVKTSSTRLVTGAQAGLQIFGATSGGNMTSGEPALSMGTSVATGQVGIRTTPGGTYVGTQWYPANLYADLSEATAATINQIRQAFQIQKLLERDARGGTRYTEIVRSHFGVLSPDARLQRPEYIGGGYQSVNVNAVVQTVDNTDGPLGQLAAYGTSAGQHRFNLNATEHGYIIGLANVRADLTYQQGLRKHWSRRTRYDYYMPVFANLGEQAILNQEIYCTGQTGDEDVFGYQERWAEYRYLPSEITGELRSNSPTPLDAWHLAQDFASRPTLNGTFIISDTPMARVLATGSTAPHFIMDGLFSIKAARPMPMYSVPGLVDHF